MGQIFNSLKKFRALFAAAFIFVLGNSFLNTLLSARMACEGFAMTTTGAVLSSYYTGLLAGSFLCHRLVEKIGHIRAFATFAAIMTASTLLYGLCISPWLWGLLRFCGGITTFGLFVVIESWLNECSELQHRGQVFALYMALTYMATGFGQQLLNLGNIEGPNLFILAGIVFSFCLVPILVTSGVHPKLTEKKQYRLAAIFRKAPLGMLGCLAAGLANSSFYSMTPVFCTAIGLSPHQLTWIMSLTVFSGLAAQWLVGALSDRFDRTIVLSAVAVSIAAVSVIMLLTGVTSFRKLALEMGLFGAPAFALYPLSVARAHEIFGGQDILAASAGLLFAYSIGASLSPILASGAMELLNSPEGLFAFWGLTGGALAVVALYLRNHEKVQLAPLKQICGDPGPGLKG
ncbi:MAG: MFS transporter [Syntrophobacteraceae bacterium]|nr:MFS transporter [Syntrophobacteraceae bacterium]